jgi:CRP-like cAMP-binding protein
VLDAEQLNTLAAGARRVEFDHRSIIMHGHDLGASMFVISSGTVEVSTRGAGTAIHVASLRSGEIVGEMSLLTGARRSATVTAIGPVAALEIDQATLRPMLTASPELYERFAAMLERRCTELDRIHGDGFWNLFGLSRDQIAPAIRSFFARPGTSR